MLVELFRAALGVTNTSLETHGLGDFFLGDFGGISVDWVLVVSVDDRDKDFSFVVTFAVFFFLDLGVSWGVERRSTLIAES